MMRPVIQMPDVELWSTGWIRAALTFRTEDYASSVYVDHKTPNPLKPYMVIVRNDGGHRVDMLHEAVLLAVNVYGPSQATADALARLVEGLLLSVRASSPVEKIDSQSSPMRIEDTQPRQYFVVEMTVRGFADGSMVPGFVFPVSGGGTLGIVDNGDGTFTITEGS